MIELIYGGSGSGKSAYAEKRVMELNNSHKYYVATMQVYDEEGMRKVERHRLLRAGKGFITIEKASNLSSLQKSSVCSEFSSETEIVLEKKNSCILLECLSNLVANEMFCADGSVKNSAFVEKKVCDEVLLLSELVENLVIVSNNIFEDGVEYDESTRKYMQVLGNINRFLAKKADRVEEVVVGIPVRIKG